MSSSGSDYRFQFEIAIVLVIGLLIYVFVSLAMVAGYHLWNISSKVDTVRLKQQQQQDYGPQPFNSLQTASIAKFSGADYSSEEKARGLENQLRESDRKRDDESREKRKELDDALSGLSEAKTKNIRYYDAAARARSELGNVKSDISDFNAVQADLAAQTEFRRKIHAQLDKVRDDLRTSFALYP